MKLDLARAHRRFLNLTGEMEAQDHVFVMPTRTVTLSQQATAFLQSQVGANASYRSGPLFGTWEAGGEHLKILYAAAGGYIRWLDYDPSQPFAMQETYVLGWTDALRVAHSQHIDWVGQWLASPTGGVGGHAEELRLLREANALQLVDQYKPLLFVHERRYGMEIQAYTYDAEDGEQGVKVEWEVEP